MNICRGCEHCHWTTGPRHTPEATSVIYRCHSPEVERAEIIHPVTGDKCWRDPYGPPANHQHPKCLTINTQGKCGFYERKGPE